MSERTIAAIATPLGEGGISVIRISGDEAITVADKCFKSASGKRLCDIGGYQALYGSIIDKNERSLDDAVALVFLSPKSYTGENVVEISVHGGLISTRQILRRVLECGAYMATGGEFTKRAFLNGKLDLTKAESVISLITARNDAAVKITQSALSGKISRDIQGILDKLLQTSASLAVFADYPDEDIPELTQENFAKMLTDCRQKCEKLISTYDMGRTIREGINCAIVGKPNVGKSTLMNLLCGSDRSIVTDIAGTTRDVVETTVTVGDITLNLSDTAGIHETQDVVEKFGVDKAKTQIQNAELLLAVFDASAALDKNDEALLESIKDKKCIVILNKTDLDTKLNKALLTDFEIVEISAKEGIGYDALSNKICEICNINKLSADDTVLISERQLNCVCRALDAINEAICSIDMGITLDAVGICIDDAIAALLELTGGRVTNEVCDEIFKRFCVGK